MSVSVNAVMSQLEREPGEFVVDPWVTERVTLVADQRRRVVAAAHLLRYTGDDDVIGYIEVESCEDAGRLPRHGGWADIGNLHVAESHRCKGVGAWLVGQAADWLK